MFAEFFVMFNYLKTGKQLLLMFLFLCICNSTKSQINFDSIFQQQSSQLQFYVSALAHDSMQGRETGKEGMMKAALFIAEQMKSIGLQPLKGNDGYFQYFNKINRQDPYEGINVIGAIPGSSNSKEVVIFSAHYDHLGMIKSKKDSVYNGANDNASGTALMLQLAMYYRQTKPLRTILFIAFSGEELGLIGSEDFAYSMAPDDIRAVLNFDMVGRATKNKVYLSGWEYGDVFNILNNELLNYDKTKYGTQFFKSNAPVLDFFRRSDNYSFAVYGTPAHTVSATPDSDKYYHQLKDEIQTLDFEFMYELAKTMFIATQSIVNGSMELRRIRVD
jgi:hypothetical protein